MKLSRIEPFAATPLDDRELEHVKERIQKRPPVEAAASHERGEFCVKDSTDGEAQEGILRFSDFLKKQKNKKKAAEKSLKAKALQRYQSQAESGEADVQRDSEIPVSISKVI